MFWHLERNLFGESAEKFRSISENVSKKTKKTLKKRFLKEDFFNTQSALLRTLREKFRPEICWLQNRKRKEKIKQVVHKKSYPQIVLLKM